MFYIYCSLLFSFGLCQKKHSCKLLAGSIVFFLRQGNPTLHHTTGTLRDAGVSCNYCLQLPCITESEGKAAFLSAHGAHRPQNILKRYKDYREFYRMLKRAGLWENSLYLDRKHELGIFIEDVREVLPNCVVADVRKRWPNPPNMPYKGHVPTL